MKTFTLTERQYQHLRNALSDAIQYEEGVLDAHTPWRPQFDSGSLRLGRKEALSALKDYHALRKAIFAECKVGAP